MIAIVHSIYSQSVHAPALNAGLMDNDAERYCKFTVCARARVQSWVMDNDAGQYNRTI